jgi:hypothetical protein
MNVRELIRELTEMYMETEVFIGLRSSGYHPDTLVELNNVDIYGGKIVLIPVVDLEKLA